MLMPKRVKRRKQFRGTMAGKALRGNKITNGEYGIVALEPAWIKSNQIEAARIAVTRYMQRQGQVWVVSSRISQSRRSLQRFVWVKVKVILRDLLRLLLRVV